MHMRTLAAAAALLPTILSAQTITRASAPAIGRTLTLEYTSTAGNSYSMLFSGLPLGALTIPGIGGTLFLPLGSLLVGYTRLVPASGTDAFGLPVPNSAALLGQSFAIQGLDVSPAFVLTFSTNAVELSVNSGVATITLAEGTNTATTTGDLGLASVQSSTVGAPVAMAVAKGAVQPVTHYGKLGFVQIATATGTTSSVEHAELDVDRADVVTRDMRDPASLHYQLPNGFDLYVLRDLAKPKEFFLMSLSRVTGAAVELSGSRTVDTSATAVPTTNYQPQFAFTDDGTTAIAVQGDTNNNPVGNVGVPDRIVLIKTDPSKTWANGKNVLDVSPPAGPNALHTQYNGTLRICNGWGFLEGEEPSGATGAAALWGGPIDGSAQWQRITVPNNGTGNAYYWSYSYWRSSPDGKLNVFPSGGTAASSTTDMDVMAITNISPTTTPVVLNLTKFATPTQIASWGTASLGTTGNAANSTPSLRGALSPDAKRFAFLTGAGTAAVPHQIAVVRTDGSDAGAVTFFTAGQFDAQIAQFAELWWASPTRLLFAGGGAPISGTVPPTWDLYAYDVGPNTITPVTKTTTGSKIPPFTQGGDTGNLVIRASMVSQNGIFYYFMRQRASTSTTVPSNIIGVNLLSLSVFDVTGSEFSSGTAPSLRPLFPNSWYGQLMRRAPNLEVWFVSAKDTGSATTFSDDELWRWNPEAGAPPTQVTAFNGTGASTSLVRQINDLRFRPDWQKVAFSVGIGTAATNPEDLYVLNTSGGTPTKITRTPSAGGQGIRRGSVAFTPTPLEGIVWSMGTNSRTLPTLGCAAWWCDLSGSSAPLLLTALPSATAAKHTLILNVSPINP